MPRARSENRYKAYEIYQEHEGNITNRAIADKLGIGEKTVGGWKCKDRWDEKFNGVLRKNERSTPNKKKKRGAPKGSKNALGNKGGPGGPEGNDHATKHGFFKRIFPDDEETMAILDEIQDKSPLEILWDQIQIQYLAIARAQKIMYVKNQEDLTKYLKRDRRGRNPEKEWEFQYAWDKHAIFLQAQSRAITALERLIARYEELLLKELDTEEQQLRIDKLRAEIEKIKSPDDVDIQNYLDALHHAAHDIWADEPNAEKEEDDEGEADE